MSWVYMGFENTKCICVGVYAYESDCVYLDFNRIFSKYTSYSILWTVT